MSDAAASAPLLAPPTPAEAEAQRRQNEQHYHEDEDSSSRITKLRRWLAEFLLSRGKHFLVMGVVTLDVAALLVNIFIQLIACEMHQNDERWVQDLISGIEGLGLFFSSLFMVELAACLFCFGFGYLKSTFHLFDSVIIVLSFVIDVTAQGLTESIGSLVVILRLWRLAKISEEIMIGATERMEMLEQHLEDLDHENKQLRRQLGIETQENVPPV